MENNRVKLIMETMWNTEWQGAERDTGLLQSALLGLCAMGKITKGGGGSMRGICWRRNCRIWEKKMKKAVLYYSHA